MAESGEAMPMPAGGEAAVSAAPLSAQVSGQRSLCPHEYFCPITGMLMREPVLLVETGHTFEKWAVERWFAQGNRRCPLTGVALKFTQVSPNLTLRKLIQDWTARNPNHSAVANASSSGEFYPQEISNPQEFLALRMRALQMQNASSPLPSAADMVSASRWLQAGIHSPDWSSMVGNLPPQNPPQNVHRAPRPYSPPLWNVSHGSWRAPQSFGQAPQIFGQAPQNNGQAPQNFRAFLQPETPLLPADDDEPLDSNAQASSDQNQEADHPTVEAQPRLSLVPEFDTIGPLSREMLILAHVAAPETETRVPIDLVAVLDVSGSMAGDRIALVKETMLFVISQLQPSDRLSVVAFSDTAKRTIRLTRGTEQGKERLRAAVQGLRATGGTRIASGLRLGLHVMTSRREKNHVGCMFLLSDGQDNVRSGEDFATSNQELLTSATRDGISVHTFGYGRDHDERILDSIADKTNGTFTYVRNNAEVKEAVAQTLGGALSVALQATIVELTAGSGVAVLFVRAGAYEASVDDAKASAKIELKDLYTGETRDVLITVGVPAAGSDRLAPTELLFGQLQYTVPGQEEASQSPLVTLSVSRDESPEGMSPNLDVDIQRNRFKAAEAMRDADRLATEGRLDQSRQILATALEEIKRSVSAQAPACVAMLEDLQRLGGAFRSMLEYQSEGSKAVKSQSRMHRSQRAVYTSFGPDGLRPPQSSDQYMSRAALQMRQTASELAPGVPSESQAQP